MNRNARTQQRRCTWTARLLIMAIAATLLITMIPRGGVAYAADNQRSLINTTVSQTIDDITLPDDEPTPEETEMPDDFTIAEVEPTEPPVENPDDLVDNTATPTETPVENPDDLTTEPWTPDPHGTIEIHKWECPEGVAAVSWDEYLAACTLAMNGVPFHASSNGVDLPTQTTGDSGDGAVIWNDVDSGNVVIQEELPAGYLEPVAFCGFTGYIVNDNGIPAIVDGFVQQVDVTGGQLLHNLLLEGFLFCDWFNIPAVDDEPGSITIYKHTCEAGYDVNDPASNPWLDCPELTNGVLFTLFHGADVPLQTMTGDSIDGGVSWGGLTAGDYQVQETLPADTAYAFIFGCYSAIADAEAAFAPTDLVAMEFDQTLLVDLLPGQDLVCHWYNVPNLHGGTVIITKYWCDGDTYTVVSCDIYESGAAFELVDAWSNGYQVVTGADGTVAIALDAGAYDLSEVGGSWCLAEASNVDGSGNIVVVDGEITEVTVFNCGPRDVPGKSTPGKFPNTGIGPVASFETAA